MRGLGFDVTVEGKAKRIESAAQSAFIKSNTLPQLLVIEAGEDVIRGLPKGQMLQIKVEVDTTTSGTLFPTLQNS
jgi:hypothetical protein